MELRREREPCSIAYCSGSLSKSVSDENPPRNFEEDFHGDVGRLMTFVGIVQETGTNQKRNSRAFD